MKHSRFSLFNFKTERGFSLVEMIVAMGIFAIVAVVALGALVKIISANKKAQSIQAAVTNINYALDSMSRELRAGTDYYCSNTPFNSAELDTGTPCWDLNSNTVYLAFNSSRKSSDNECNFIHQYKFELDDGEYILSKAQQRTCNGTQHAFDFSSVVDSNVHITGYYLTVSNERYPLATIRISGYAGVREREKTFFDVQTAVSPRVI